MPTELEIAVLRGNPSEDELAALIAVVSDAYEAEVEGAIADDTPPASAWARAQRAMRPPLSHGPGAWERYGR
ncbi:MAG: acyl-CoA carboxylase subunit epsilon [Microbacteriaceae bacterium]|nr:acyl-CoA carboxylase subunit epsilon [Microbacteriaceae bacterium]